MQHFYDHLSPGLFGRKEGTLGPVVTSMAPHIPGTYTALTALLVDIRRDVSVQNSTLSFCSPYAGACVHLCRKTEKIK